MTSQQAKLVAVFAALAAVAGCTREPQPANAMAMSTTILITDTGSTNTFGYRVTIDASGVAAFSSGAGSGRTTLPGLLFAQLKHDIAAASPLASLTPPACMKSASFGTSTFISIGSDRSPDLSCPGTDKVQALEQDISQIVEYLKIGNVARSRGTELPASNDQAQGQ